MSIISGNPSQPSVAAGQPKLDITQTTEYTCKSCGNNKFESRILIRRASPLLTGYPQEAFVPIDIFVCDSCGEIVKELTPNLQ